MSKERLEEARLMAEMLRVETRLPHDFPFDLVDWLVEQAERVEELEEEVDRLNGALHYQLSQENIRNEVNRKLRKQNKRYREALEEIMKIQENHEWNLYGLAYGIAERTLFELEGEE